jgi:predicted 3-demethylubiquinone-9 3-methyltransferase (glyoxalase superfamily)
MKVLVKILLAIVLGYSGGAMSKSVKTHLMFQGDANEALELYASVFPEFDVQEKALHEDGEMKGQVRLAHVEFAGHELIIFNSAPVHDFTFTPSMSLFVEFEDSEALKAAFEALSKDGKVAMPLDDYGFSPLFGWCQDRFGVSWQLSLSAAE